MTSKIKFVVWCACVLCVLSGCGAEVITTPAPAPTGVDASTAILTRNEPIPTATLPPIAIPTASSKPPSLQRLTVFTYVPPNAPQPLRVVIALHGMGGEGKVFASSLLKEAERNHWLLVSPTMAYQDWRDPNVVAREDVENSLRLAATLDALAAQTGVSIKPKALLYGFSRGAQFAHRFALFFPERVGRVAALSAGTYTLPEQKIDAAGDGRPAPAKLPYGVSDMEKALGHPIDRAQLKQVQFLVVVGEKDNVANDVPRAWDPFLGATRVERARTFSQSMEKAGVRCALKIVPDVGHEINPTMQSLAINFLREADAPLGKQAASHETR